MYLQEASTNTLALDGQPEIAGAMLSFKVMVSEQELALPAASVAVRVTSCVVLCPLSTVPAAGDCVSVGVPQLSVIVSVLIVRLHLRSALTPYSTLYRHFVITGATFSITLTVKLQVAVL